ncbi:hypothetical protein BDV95DRAFT_43370 [Massariosphaeria phaeospora]|uniref:Fungal-specific transcription factor domain-containing protein n=1 Tax=Massariosphaeria phaeospora TaxID=100035 RepID=A0A7C8M8C8_9PLEO|nr:hypothetical protein BDV95DRAFT_43370 [Massariosphaeria phaeospora]
MMFCSYCGQGFKRDEHLERHILTHTNVRPFRCRDCRLAFKRKDLLRRHYRSIHAPPSDDDNQPDDDTAPSRNAGAGRIPIACINCAASKTKCDNQMPCGRCVKKKLTCERRTYRRSSCKDNTKPIQPPTSEIKPQRDDSTSHMQFEWDSAGNSGESPRGPNSPLSDPTASARRGDLADLSISEAQHEREDHEYTSEQTAASSPSPKALIDTLDPGTDTVSYQSIESLPQFRSTDSMDIHLTTDISFPAFFPSTQQAPTFHDVDFDILMQDCNFDELLAGTNATPRLLSASSETFSDSDWSFVQEDVAVRKISYPVVAAPMAALPTNFADPDLSSQWSSFCCNPRIGDAPSSTFTSLTSLASLRLLDNPAIWSLCSLPSDIAHGQNSPLAIFPSDFTHCESFTRDRLLAVTQQIWRMSREKIVSSFSADRQQETTNAWMERIILLPPTEIIQQILQKYVTHESQRFHLLPAQEFPTSASLLDTENKILSGIQTLSIIAQVTRSAPAAEARALSNGLAEVCRIVIQDAESAMHPEFLDASLSLLQLLQWSGDAWHMTSVPKLWEQHAKVQFRRNLPLTTNLLISS